MRSGPKALNYQGTLFRVSELAWVKVCPMPPWRWALKLVLMALGPIFVYLVADSKGGNYMNVEGILGILIFHIGYTMGNDIRIATSGDLQDSYEARGGSGERKAFSQWVEALGHGADECKVGSPQGSYSCWFNLSRIAWARSSFTYDLYGLTAIPVYLGYDWLIGRHFDITLSPILADLSLLQFDNGSGSVSLCCQLIAALGLIAALVSLRPVVEVCATGGLRDNFALSGADRARFFEKLAGLDAASQSQAASSSASAKVEAKPAPSAPPAAAPAPAPAAPVVQAAPPAPPAAPKATTPPPPTVNLNSPTEESAGQPATT